MSTLKSTVYVNGTMYGPGADIPDEDAVLITNPKAWDGDVPTATATTTPSQDGDAGYAQLTKSQLQDLIKDRNDGRDDDAKINPDGANKADLIAALKADDQAGTSEQDKTDEDSGETA